MAEYPLTHWLERIREQERKYGSELQPPLSEEDLRQCQEKTRSEPGVTLPEGSCNFLRQTDGLAWNGVRFYASHTATLVGREPDVVMEGIVEENLAWRE